MLAKAAIAARARPDAAHVPFDVLRVPRGGPRPKRVGLVAVIGPGDAGESVLTIMQPGED